MKRFLVSRDWKEKTWVRSTRQFEPVQVGAKLCIEARCCAGVGRKAIPH